MRTCIEAHPFAGPRSRAAAFTFPEVLIAVAILVWFLAGVVVAGSRVTALLQAQRETVTAAQMLQERTEQIRSASYAQLTNPTYVQGTLLAAPTNSAAGLYNLVETLTISVYPADSSTPLQAVRQGGAVTLSSTNASLGSAAAVRVDLQLAWQNHAGRARTRQISTVAASGGINH